MATDGTRTFAVAERAIAAAHDAALGSAPPQNFNPQLASFWDKPVEKLCSIPKLVLTDQQRERHQIYSRLLMAIAYHYWNGYKRGRPEGRDGGEYPWNDPPRSDDPQPYGGSYLGHNIAALAVDDLGRVIDFDFNHIALFSSSAEHAEARLVRRLFSLANVGEAWSAWPRPAASFPGRSVAAHDESRGVATSLGNVTVYTTLESCAQCAGIMALAQVKEVVYLQTDPGAVFIGRILWNLIKGKMSAPLPIAAGEVGLDSFKEINDAYNDFIDGVKTKPFFIPRRGEPDRGSAVTSFLCTGRARAIFKRWGELPPRADDPTNQELLGGARKFLSYAIGRGRRATPHNL